VHTELANAPDWLPFVLLVNAERFGMDRGEVLDYERTLDMRRSLLTRKVRWRSPAGKTVDIHIERFASLADPHVLAIRYQVTPLDFDGRIEFRAGINGHVDNALRGAPCRTRGGLGRGVGRLGRDHRRG